MCTRLKEKWSEIKHPTLTALMLMIFTVVEKHGWEKVVIWKMDLQGALNLLWFNPNSACYLAFPLTNNNSAIHLAGMFGWVGMPYVFQVVTRAVLALCAMLIFGMCLMYVDDIMGASPEDKVAHDMTAAHNGVTGLLGRDAIAVKKNEAGRDIDLIGWRIDMNLRSVTISERNLLKTLHAFFDFDLKEKIELKKVERMASLASRCSQLSRAMRPYTVALYMATSDYHNCQFTKRQLPALAKAEVSIWRAFLVMCRFDREHLFRPIESFSTRAPSIALEYDASLKTISAGLSTLYPPSVEKHLIAYSYMDVPFEITTDSSFQNCYEFLGIILGLLLAIGTGIRHRAAIIWGDSISSLKWALKDRVASTIARRANIVYTLTAARFDVTIDSTCHVPGEENIVWDGFTREKVAEQLGIDPSLGVFFPSTHPIPLLIGLCDPRVPLISSADHASLSHQTITLLDSLQTLPSLLLPESKAKLLSNKIGKMESTN
jgi:hypothetical protein